MADSDRGWRTMNTDPARTQAVTAADVQRVAKQYFEPANRNVLIFYTSRGGAKRTPDQADLACDVASLGCVYLGGFTFAQLARSLRMKEMRAGAIARADAMFRSDRAPWCPEIF